MPLRGKAKKKGGNDLGRAVLKQQYKDRLARRTDGTGFHVADLATSSNPLQSVVDMSSSVEEFIASAVLAERKFEAERSTTRIIDADARGSNAAGTGGGVAVGGAGGRLVAGAAAGAGHAGSGVIKSLRIPRRPHWDASTTKEELHRAEKDGFILWRREIAVLEAAASDAATSAAAAAASAGAGSAGHAAAAHSAESVTVTPFEKNIEVWRQLWRVVERADVVIQVVDARNPLLYRVPDLEAYTKEINPQKANLLLINKADYLTPAQRVAWGRYLRAAGVDFLFFSARRELQRLIAADRRQRAAAEGALAAGNGPTAAAAGESDSNDEDSEGAGSGEDDGAEAKNAAAACDKAGTGGDATTTSDAAGASNTAAAISKADAATASDIAEDELGHYWGFAGADAEAAAADGDEEGAEAAAAETAAMAALRRSLPATDGALLDSCRIRTREGVSAFLHKTYGHLATEAGTALGTSDPAALQRRAEAKQRAKAAALAARKAELAQRRAQAKRLVEVGLGAQVRFGALADALAMESDDDADADESGEHDGTGTDGDDDGVGDERRPLEVGLVGYPNVGKSSSINALLGATPHAHGTARVAVAATPGKTKHFQTQVLNDDITLVDCPGLVFPSFVTSRAEMTVAGILPLHQLRTTDWAAPMRLLCSRIPRDQLAGLYGLKLPAADRQPTVGELLDAYCMARGYWGSGHSGPEQPRGARELLAAYCEGKLLYCHPPPPVHWGWRWALGAAPAGASGAAGTGDGADAVLRAIDAAAAAAATASSASAASVVRGPTGRVTMADNVLVPAAAPTNSAASTSAAGGPDTSKAVGTEAAASSGDDEDGSEESDNDDDDGDGSDSDSSDLDEAALHAFSRVVIVRGEPAITAATAGAGAGAGAGGGVGAGAGKRAAALSEDETDGDAADHGEGLHHVTNQGVIINPETGEVVRRVTVDVLQGKAAVDALALAKRGGEAAGPASSTAATTDGGAGAAAARAAASIIAHTAAASSTVGAHPQRQGGSSSGTSGKASASATFKASAAAENGGGAEGLGDKRHKAVKPQRRRHKDREADPYGTTAVADAASRKWHEAEIAAVNAGVVVHGAAATMPAAVGVGSATSTPAGLSKGTRPAALGSRTAGDASVLDSVPPHLRGRIVMPKPRQRVQADRP